jgi:hypothetical protein
MFLQQYGSLMQHMNKELTSHWYGKNGNYIYFYFNSFAFFVSV